MDKLNIWRNNKKGITWTDSEGNILKGAIDNLLFNKLTKKFVVLDYKTRGFPLKENTHEHYQNQLDIYSFLLIKNNYEVENFAYLLFYVPKEVLQTGEVIFETTLKKMKVNTDNACRIWQKAIRLLNGECPDIKCEWCKGC
jgi:hypothetical protein